MSKLWLIDAGYLFNARHSVESQFRFNYKKLRDKLEEYGHLWRAYYLNSTPNPPTDQQDSFHSWLRCGPPHGPKIITKLYSLKPQQFQDAYCEECRETVSIACPSGIDHNLINMQQKGVDVGLATLALVHKDKYDTLLLSSGDGDLLDAIEFISEQGKKIELCVFKSAVSTELQSRADNIYWMNDFADNIRS